MALRRVLTYPDPVLTRKSVEVKKVDSSIKNLVRDMVDTMYEEDGVGLAAPQIGISKRIIMVSPNAKRGEERALINPVILEKSSELILSVEGCLSVPGVSVEVRRAVTIKFEAVDIRGKRIVETVSDFHARVIQHEMDHLAGILLIDHVDFEKRQALLGGQYQRL